MLIFKMWLKEAHGPENLSILVDNLNDLNKY
jgi:hypothetical protein